MSETLFDRNGFGVGLYSGPGGTPMAQVTGVDESGQARCIVVSRLTFDLMIQEVTRQRMVDADHGDWRNWADDQFELIRLGYPDRVISFDEWVESIDGVIR